MDSQMATRRQAERAIEKLGGSLEHNSDNGWSTDLCALQGYHWSDEGIHALTIFWYETPGTKAEYWDHVIEAIDGLGIMEKCCKESCSEWHKDTNTCGVWDE